MVYERAFLKKGKHSTALFLSPEHATSIGFIIAHWGRFESVFNAVLDGFIRGEASGGKCRDTVDWVKREFRRRRELFKAICT